MNINSSKRELSEPDEQIDFIGIIEFAWRGRYFVLVSLALALALCAAVSTVRVEPTSVLQVPALVNPKLEVPDGAVVKRFNFAVTQPPIAKAIYSKLAASSAKMPQTLSTLNLSQENFIIQQTDIGPKSRFDFASRR